MSEARLSRCVGDAEGACSSALSEQSAAADAADSVADERENCAKYGTVCCWALAHDMWNPPSSTTPLHTHTASVQSDLMKGRIAATVQLRLAAGRWRTTRGIRRRLPRFYTRTQQVHKVI